MQELLLRLHGPVGYPGPASGLSHLAGVPGPSLVWPRALRAAGRTILSVEMLQDASGRSSLDRCAVLVFPGVLKVIVPKTKEEHGPAVSQIKVE